jgi:hypothetical protein
LKDTGEITPVDQLIATFEMVFENDMKSTDSVLFPIFAATAVTFIVLGGLLPWNPF